MTVNNTRVLTYLDFVKGLDPKGNFLHRVIELIAKKNDKAALKYYNKVLKKEPDNYTAIKNCVLMARRDKNVKLEKKYLPMLVKYSPDETEKISASARLEALNSKK